MATRESDPNQISWIEVFLIFNLERYHYAHLYGIRHCCSRLPRDAGFCAGTRSTLAIRGSETARSVQHGHTEHTGRRRQGPETGGARDHLIDLRAHKRGRYAVAFFDDSGAT